ncbi:MAG: M15 family metallopeptidase [Aureispira sp.]|nr:M15 family metallopeptidase [Aureispira sp.]
MIRPLAVLLWAIFCCTACNNAPVPSLETTSRGKTEALLDSSTLKISLGVANSATKTAQISLKSIRNNNQIDSILNLHDSSWVDLQVLIPDLMVDIRYASTNNFMKTKIYDCGECYSRLAVAKAVMKIQEELKSQEMGLKMFDCYRPRSAQYKLWKVVPDPRYVSPPGKGSVHSRGGALDLTIVDDQGAELNMGTPYDFFGKEAYWAHIEKQPEEVQKNRKLLLTTMQKYGFKTVSTEWWHYSYRRAWFQLSDMQWPCD